ncbi:MAG: hypothetical protein R6U70_08640 [Bacillota bacterium]
MPFIIHGDLADMAAYQELKTAGDPILQQESLEEYTIEIRPATDLEERALAGEGLAPVEDSGDNFVVDTGRMVVYHARSAQNPLLETLEADPAGCARDLVDRLSQYVESHGTSGP